MGRVYRARQPGLDRLVALKVILREHAEENEAVRRFRREASAMSRVRHPHVIEVIDSGVHQGVMWLAMELLEGHTLKDELKARPMLPVLEAIGHARDLCRGLEAVHEQKLVHRDIKPANLMLVSVGVKLMDFGLVKDTEATAITEYGSVVGTPAFVPPEMIKGEESDHRVDIYQAGMVLYLMLAGRLPYVANSALEYIELATAGNAPSVASFNPHVTPALDQLMHT